MRVCNLLAGVGLAVLALTTAPSANAGPEEAKKVQVLTTTTDLREIAKVIGGDHVNVHCVTNGPEDPHFIEARPSLIRAAADADVFIVCGMELEVGYEPLLREQSRNARIQKGQPGYVDASNGIAALEVPSGNVDRSMGDVHRLGNPHYLLDPVRAKHVAGTIADAFVAVDASHAESYRERLAGFRKAVDAALWGDALLEHQPATRLENRLQRGELLDFLKARKLDAKLGGWAARLAPYSKRKIVSYHGLFVYLLDRFHLVEHAKIEPKPGIDPTPRHTAEVVKRMKSDDARVVVHATYHPSRTAEQVAKSGGAKLVRLAHMPGALAGTASYLEMIDANVKALEAALRETAAQ